VGAGYPPDLKKMIACPCRKGTMEQIESKLGDYKILDISDKSVRVQVDFLNAYIEKFRRGLMQKIILRSQDPMIFFKFRGGFDHRIVVGNIHFKPVTYFYGVNNITLATSDGWSRIAIDNMLKRLFDGCNDLEIVEECIICTEIKPNYIICTKCGNAVCQQCKTAVSSCPYCRSTYVPTGLAVF
jgi:uncharacterized protein YbaR (Trm112 family)